MKSLKTILPICLVGVMAPTVAIVATSCGSSSTINSFNNGEKVVIEYKDVYKLTGLSEIDNANYPKPTEYAKRMIEKYDIKQIQFEGTISNDSRATVSKYLVDNNLIDCNVLALLIIMDTYNMVYALHYSSSNASTLQIPESDIGNINEINNCQIEDLTLTINKISQVNNSNNFNIDFNITTSNLDKSIGYSVIYNDKKNYNGFTLCYGHATGNNVTLSMDENPEYIHFSDEFTVTSPNGHENEGMKRNLTNAFVYTPSEGNTTSYETVSDLISALYPKITIQ